MKVLELIELLEDCDPEAEVFLMTQPAWPFECSVRGIAVREELESAEDDEGEARAPRRRDAGAAANDVFILEGEQLRYGSKVAWDAR